MGYACPVCSTPQADRRHLADHLAVTAMVHGDAHEDWLDEHVEDWSSMGPEDLGPVVAEYATETEYEEVFEDTTDAAPHPHDNEGVSGERLEDHLAREGHRGPGGREAGRGDLTADQRAILAEAREMTREMAGADADDEDPATGETDAADDEDHDGGPAGDGGTEDDGGSEGDEATDDAGDGSNRTDDESDGDRTDDG